MHFSLSSCYKSIYRYYIQFLISLLEHKVHVGRYFICFAHLLQPQHPEWCCSSQHMLSYASLTKTISAFHGLTQWKRFTLVYKAMWNLERSSMHHSHSITQAKWRPHLPHRSESLWPLNLLISNKTHDSHSHFICQSNSHGRGQKSVASSVFVNHLNNYYKYFIRIR